MAGSRSLDRGRSRIVGLAAILGVLVASRCATSSRPPVDFTADVRLFTAYAFMNAAGNDAEWRKAGMHPLRTAIREDLLGRIDPEFRAKLAAFNASHGGSWTLYGPYALLTSGPPDFRLAYDPRTSPFGRTEEEDKAGLSELFAEFYRRAALNALWAKYRPLLQAENDRFKPFAAKALGDIEAYCRLRPGYFSGRTRLHFQSIPLMLYFTAWTAKVNGEIWIVDGPQEGSPDASAFYHETVHDVVGPLVAASGEAIGRRSELLAVAKSHGSVGYETWPDLFEDSVIRTIDKVLQAKLYGWDKARFDQSLVDEYRLGFLPCFSIAESLQAYERGNSTFQDAFPSIVEAVDVARETERWEAFWKDR
jgi:hypothetical protein